MQALQSVKVHASTDSANQDDSSVATNSTLLQPMESTLSGQTAVITKKWSSKIEVPIGVRKLLCEAGQTSFTLLLGHNLQPLCMCRLGDLHPDSCSNSVLLRVSTQYYQC